MYIYIYIYNVYLYIERERNACTHLASGLVVANFDDDDLYAPAYLETMMEVCIYIYIYVYTYIYIYIYIYIYHTYNI